MTFSPLFRLDLLKFGLVLLNPALVLIQFSINLFQHIRVEVFKKPAEPNNPSQAIPMPYRPG